MFVEITKLKLISGRCKSHGGLSRQRNGPIVLSTDDVSKRRRGRTEGATPRQTDSDHAVFMETKNSIMNAANSCDINKTRAQQYS